MTIGELARRTGMTVRNIRAHQTRGLLPPPEVHGRTGYYTEEHVARIELTREMQAEGLNLEAIRRVLDSTEGSSSEIVDFARAVRAPFEDETPEIFEADRAGRDLGSEGARPEADQPRRKARHPARTARRQDRGDQPAPAARRRRAGRARRQPRRRPSTSPTSCAARPTPPPAPSSSSSSRRSGSRSKRPASPRRIGRRFARPSTACARSLPTRSWRCFRSRWARRPRRPANAPCATPPRAPRSAQSAAVTENLSDQSPVVASKGLSGLA